MARLPSLAALSIKRRGIPLRLKLEYDGNNYQNDFAGKLPQASHFNVGAVYRAASWANLNLSYERGNTSYVWLHVTDQFQRSAPCPARYAKTGISTCA
ncbi:YjbH domain-containing protein [Escherichia coli]